MTVVIMRRILTSDMINRTNRKMDLGALEDRVMSILWQGGHMSVREVNECLRERKLAHTTIMTTLDRLFKKGLLSRTKEGLAYIYSPAMTREEYQQRLVGATVAGLMSKLEDAKPVLAAFVDAATELDASNLAALEALIAERKQMGE